MDHYLVPTEPGEQAPDGDFPSELPDSARRISFVQTTTHMVNDAFADDSEVSATALMSAIEPILAPSADGVPVLESTWTVAEATTPSAVREGWMTQGGVTLLALVLGGLGLVGILHGVPTFLQTGYSDETLVLYVVGSLAIALLALAATSTRSNLIERLGPSTPTGATAFTSIALVLAAAAGRLAYERTIGEGATDILLLLGTSLALVLIVVLAGRMSLGVAFETSVNALHSLPRTWLIGGLVVCGMAIVTRLAYLDRFPTVNHGDEFMYMVYARGFRDGVSLNPFRVHEGLLHIELWNWLVGQISRPFPDAVWSYRLTGAILGVLSVGATFLLGRRVLDRTTGIVGAVVLSVLPLHIWASRNALDNITDAVALPMALWLADRTWGTRDRRDAIACGIMMGLGFYGYFGARIFPAVIAVSMLAILFQRPFLRSVLDFARLGLWTLAGFLVAAAPALGFFRSEPDSFFGRVRSVTAAVSDRSPTLESRLQNAIEGIAYPLSEPTGIFFRAVSPKMSVLGSISALFIGVGACFWVVTIILRVIQRRPAWPTARPGGLLIAWGMIAGLVGQTDGMESQRFLALTPIWALAVASGIVMVARALIAFTHKAAVVHVATAILILAILTQNLTWYFSEDREITSWGGPEASRFYDLGWRLKSAPEDTRVLGAAWPELMYERTGGMQFWAPGRDKYVTFLEEFSEDQPPFGAPRLADGQILILGPSHRDEICYVMQANPDATVGGAYDRLGGLLYIVVTSDQSFPFRLDESPAESTYVTIAPPTCSGTNVVDAPNWPD